MIDKKHILLMLNTEFDRWEQLLSRLSEAQLTAPGLPSGWSIKDVVAHVWAWQQRSIARLEAALLHREPEFPMWAEGLEPELEADLDLLNAWLFEAYHDQPWSSVYQEWRQGFLRFIDLADAIPEEDLLDAGKYPWMEGQPLSVILLASYEHHHEEHLEPLLAWLQRGSTPVVE